MARPEKARLGEILVEQKLLTEEQLKLALEEQKRSGRRLGRVLVESGFITEEQISEALSRQLKIPYVNLKHYNIKPEVMRMLPEARARRFRAIVLDDDGKSVKVGMADPTDLNAYDQIARLLKRDIDVWVVTESQLLETIDRFYRRTEQITDLAQELEAEFSDTAVDFGALAATPGIEEAPVVKLLQTIFEDATQVRASDIHIEPQERRLHIRFRIDGVLHLQTEADLRIASALVLRLKLMSGLDISEKRLPQDGRFNVKVRQAQIDVRVSTMPTQYGESVVMRLLNQTTGILGLDRLGIPAPMLARIREVIARPSGIPGIPGTAATAAAPAAQTGGVVSRTSESSRVTTASDSDFWGDVTKSLNAIVGSSEGRSVIVNPQSGVIVVRAMPTELRNVESFLKAMQLVVERQVVLEAKLIQVTLSDGSQTGINWAAFPDGGRRAAAGVVTKDAQIGTGGELVSSALTATLGAGGALAGKAAGGVFGLALQTGNFAALMSFLETQGTINVLSSPRIATINNQKAVLKVGTDEFFVTNISTTAVTSGAGTTTTPSITVQPFFSGIALDVTPQIDDGDNIILHIHPSVSSVSEKQKVVNLGAAGSFTLPLASSEINETDTIVRVQDGNIVAIGGLMKQQTSSDRSQVPGAGDAPGWGGLFRQRANSSLKSELVILLKPTIIRSDRDWEQGLAETRDRIRTMERR